MPIEQEPCAFSHSCVNTGPRQRLQGTALFFCSPHFHLLELPSGAGTTAGELAGTRTESRYRARQSRTWDLGMTGSGSWM
jgi:hypothetical protein